MQKPTSKLNNNRVANGLKTYPPFYVYQQAVQSGIQEGVCKVLAYKGHRIEMILAKTGHFFVSFPDNELRLSSGMIRDVANEIRDACLNSTVEFSGVASNRFSLLKDLSHYLTCTESTFMEFHLQPSSSRGMIEKHSMTSANSMSTALIEKISSVWGSIERFRKHDGIWVEGHKQGRSVGWCFSGARFKGLHEASVWVDSKFRKQGIANILVQRYMDELRKRGHDLCWTCMSHNTASIKIAQRYEASYMNEHPLMLIDNQHVKSKPY